MTKRDFLLEAAGFFLCVDYEELLPVSKQLDLLLAAQEEYQLDTPEGVVLWKPFEYWTCEQILEEIHNLAGLLERLYNMGKNERR
jgi:hypothetical protein